MNPLVMTLTALEATLLALYSSDDLDEATQSTARNSRISITTAPAAGSPRGSTKEPAMFHFGS